MSEPSTSANSTTPLSFKDFLIPLSIVVAGLLIGAGLYLGGLKAVPADNKVTAEKVEDTTNKIDPVTAADHIRGSLEAPIKIVEYSDFDCPYCNRFHDTMKNIVKKYPGTEVAWVYRHFPLTQLHPQTLQVASASECVAELGGNEAFWNFSDTYMVARGNGDTADHDAVINKIVAQLGLNQQAFADCLKSDKYQAVIKTNTDDAVETGGRGTPWNIIIGPSGKTYPVNGALPQTSVEQIIELAKKEA